MHQPRNEPVPDEGVDVPKVRPQGAMCNNFGVISTPVASSMQPTNCRRACPPTCVRGCEERVFVEPAFGVARSVYPDIREEESL